VVTPEYIRTLALSFEEAEEQPHFEKSSFRIKKKIFATLDVKRNTAVVKLSPVDQSVFCDYNKAAMYAANGAWGKQGWTIIELKKVRKDLFKDALTTSYCTVAPKKLADKYRIH
jgi:predicted DNA-binding protein (MmcQ/YjbR family)